MGRSPGRIKPLEKLEQLKQFLNGYQMEEHHAGDPGYGRLSGSAVCLTVVNPSPIPAWRWYLQRCRSLSTTFETTLLSWRSSPLAFWKTVSAPLFSTSTARLSSAVWCSPKERPLIRCPCLGRMRQRLWHWRRDPVRRPSPIGTAERRFPWDPRQPQKHNFHPPPFFYNFLQQ